MYCLIICISFLSEIFAQEFTKKRDFIENFAKEQTQTQQELTTNQVPKKKRLRLSQLQVNQQKNEEEYLHPEVLDALNEIVQNSNHSTVSGINTENKTLYFSEEDMQIQRARCILDYRIACYKQCNENISEEKIDNFKQALLNEYFISQEHAQACYKFSLRKSFKQISSEEKIEAYENILLFQNHLTPRERSRYYYQIAFHKSYVKEISNEEKIRAYEDSLWFQNHLTHREQAQCYYTIAFYKRLNKEISNEEKIRAYEDSLWFQNHLTHREQAQCYYTIAFHKFFDNSISIREKIKNFERIRREHYKHLSEKDQKFLDCQLNLLKKIVTTQVPQKK
jgi:hypothetical protein